LIWLIGLGALIAADAYFLAPALSQGNYDDLMHFFDKDGNRCGMAGPGLD